ncbi:NAD(P)H:quinone oxidoreductase-like [Capsicum chacoense]
MTYAMASMGGLTGFSQNVLDGSLQISGSRLNTVSTSRIALSRPAGLSVRAEQGSFDTETSRRAVLSHVAAGLAGTFANAAFAEARSIKGVAPPPLFGGLQGMEATAMAAQRVLKVVGISGELDEASPNRGLVRAAVEICKNSIPGMEMENLDISSLPFLNTDLVVNGTSPPEVEAFRKKIAEADCYFFASPEYNYSVTGLLKNVIDWGSYPTNVWGDKAAAIVSTGYDFGGGRSQYHLRQMGVRVDIHFINTPEFFLNVLEPPPKFDKKGNLTDKETKNRLREILLALQAFALRLDGNCK